MTYANDAFVALSGYSREELIGKSHNIVRHPDMPPQAFKWLWDTVKDGRPWSVRSRIAARTATITGYVRLSRRFMKWQCRRLLIGAQGTDTRPDCRSGSAVQAAECKRRSG